MSASIPIVELEHVSKRFTTGSGLPFARSHVTVHAVDDMPWTMSRSASIGDRRSGW
jgi:hypothetical protein